MSKLEVGAMVMLVRYAEQYEDLPPLGSCGTVVGFDDPIPGVYEISDAWVLFDEHPCPAGEPEWVVPPSCLIVISPPPTQTTFVEELEIQ